MKKSLIITSIAGPNNVLQNYANNCAKNDIQFYVVGDNKSPKDFQLRNCNYYSIERQRALDLNIVKNLPENHYTRKNIGYLESIKDGTEVIIETDDDNLPYNNFWEEPKNTITGNLIKNKGWINVYSFFSEEQIWPRGYPIELIRSEIEYQSDEASVHYCPIQQGLADDNPDVDAIYRLTSLLPIKFKGETILLGDRSWSPFNSQNTVWFKEAFPLMYLPSTCTFRMTDIWRSYVAQRVAWAYNWKIAFYSPTVYQERNEHNLLKDFEDEVPGYLNNDRIRMALEALNLSNKIDDIYNNLYLCYKKLVEEKYFESLELDILNNWISDLRKVNH